jgi:hypothetical protein
MFSQYVLVETRCFATGILGRHAAVALMTGCEALPTKYRGSLLFKGRDRKREWNVLLGALPGLGPGLTDMVSICKHLQYRKEQQAKEADRLGPNGKRPGQEFITCSCANAASSVYGVDLRQLIVFIAERGKLVTSPFRAKPTVRQADGVAGARCLTKQMPCCNGRDTELSPARKGAKFWQVLNRERI